MGLSTTPAHCRGRRPIPLISAAGTTRYRSCHSRTGGTYRVPRPGPTRRSSGSFPTRTAIRWMSRARAQGVQAGAEAGEAAGVPRVRSPPHVREPAARRRRPDHLREQPARPRHADDDAAVLREVDSSQGRRWVEVLDHVDIAAVGLEVGTKKWNQTGPHRQVVAQAIEKLGEPSGIRTLDPLIKSSLPPRRQDTRNHKRPDKYR